jgi:hypothetical protein
MVDDILSSKSIPSHISSRGPSGDIREAREFDLSVAPFSRSQNSRESYEKEERHG